MTTERRCDHVRAPCDPTGPICEGAGYGLSPVRQGQGKMRLWGPIGTLRAVSAR